MSMVVLAVGLIVYFSDTADVFRTHPYTRRAFEFWLLQWWGFILIFIILTTWPDANRQWLLAAVDLQSLFALGFFWTFLRGRDYERHHVAMTLLFTYLSLFCWNLMMAPQALAAETGSTVRSLWTLPSEVVSAMALGLVGWVMYQRHGARAIPFGAVAFIYIALQRPVYASTFGGAELGPTWVTLLAVGKLLYAGIFYTVFFQAGAYAKTIRLAAPQLFSHPLAKKVYGLIGSLIIGLITHFITEWLSGAFRPFVG